MEGIIQNIQQVLGVPAFLINQCTFIPEFIREAIIQAIVFVPWLYFIYYAIELIERFFLKNIGLFIKFCKNLGPVFGSVISVIPECGYQVLASTFYSRKLITRGTLIAFYISCTDDALPLLFMDFSKAVVIIPIVIVKLVVAVIVGFLVDIVFFSRQKLENTNAVNIDINEPGCCHHKMMTVEHPPYWWAHPLLHTFNVFMFSVFVLIFINCLIMNMGGAPAVASVMMIDSPIQPVIGAVFGLIPNSLTSIFLALAYVKGIISLPTLMAGLTSTTGIGLYALMKYNKKNGDNTLIMVILLLTAIGVGLLMQANMDLISSIQGLFH
jgi:hypothetical protein